jgi:hypothetical protein
MTTKQPIIRPGQRTPYVKGTKQQIQERIEYLARLIARDNTKGGIHRAMKEKFGIGWRQCERYRAALHGSRARAHARESLTFERLLRGKQAAPKPV